MGLEDFEVLQPIGKGAFARVDKVRMCGDGWDRRGRWIARLGPCGVRKRPLAIYPVCDYMVIL